MARCIMKEGADVEAVREEMSRRGYTLRAYRQEDGSVKYTLRKKCYSPRKKGGV